MAISIISVSSDLSKDSMGTPAGRVILFGTVPTTIPDTTLLITPPATQTDTTVIPTETPIIAPTIPPSPDYTSASPDYSPASETESDPSEDPSSGHILPLPAVSQFLSSDDDTIDSDTPDTPPPPTHGTLFTEITASTQRSHVIPRRRVMILVPGQPIPHGRPYHYHPNGLVHMMTARKRVGPLPVQQLAMRHSVGHSSSDSSSRHSLSNHSSPDLPSTFAGHLARDRVRDIGYLADVEVGPKETRVERVTHPAIPEDILEPTQEGAVQVTYGTFGDLVQRFHDHTQAIPVHRVQVIEGVQREQGHRIVGVESTITALTERVVEKTPNTRSRASMTHEEIEKLVSRRVAEEMEAHEAARNLETLNENEDDQEGENGGNENGGNRGNRNGGKGGNGNHGMNYGGFMPMAQECTFQDFLKCKPHTFSGTEGVKMETELWNLNVKGNDMTAYTQRFQELILLCTRMVLDEEDKVERFIGGLPDKIQGNVIAVNPARLKDGIHNSYQLMDKKLQGYTARSAENKRRTESNPKDNCGQQPSFNRQNTTGQNVARAYTAGNNERKGYVGFFPYCNKWRLHHEGLCTIRCGNCKKIGHQTRDCRVTVTPNTQGATVRNQQSIVCYECERPGHFRKDCPKSRNQHRGNQTRNKTRNKTGGNEVTAKAYAIGGGGTNPDSNVDTGTFLLNNCYASMLFDSGANRSFVSTTFSALLHVAPSTLDTSYAVELADGRVSKRNIILEYHTLIVCDEKVVRIPCGDEVYLAQVTSKKAEDELEEKRLEDVRIVREFPEVFPEDLPGLPPTR
nr:hypothetical protein [Tanacetum cinerariifolium]